MKLTIDFETRSCIDLSAAGSWKYASHESTEAMCLAIKCDDRETRLWASDKFKVSGRRYLETCEVQRFIQEADIVEAHNIEFERAIWRYHMHKRFGLPDLDLNKCDCTAARSAAMALPRKLGDVCRVLGLIQQKDDSGHRLMLKMCKPRRPKKAEKIAWLKKDYLKYSIEDLKQPLDNSVWTGMPSLWHETPEQLSQLSGYCIQDVETEYELSQVVLPLSKFERQVWLADQKINETGLYVDIPNIKNIIKTLEKHEKVLLKRMESLTGGTVKSPRQAAATRDWLRFQGVTDLPDIQKQTLEKVLLQDGVSDKVREVIGIRQELSKASTSKFQAMIDRAEEDQRCRSLFMYAGAGTRRWTARAVQPQNMVRDSYSGEDLELAYEAFAEGNIEWIQCAFEDPFKAASKCLRGVITAAPGYEFLCGDFSSIEARGNAWQAGANETLECFKRGLDIYKVAAAGTFNTTYDRVIKDERRIGKVQILALGYQGGIGAFATIGKNYGLELALLADIVLPSATAKELDRDYGGRALAEMYLKREEKKAAEGKNHNLMTLDEAVACDVLKQRWRVDNPEIVNSWKRLGETAMEAVSNPGQMFIFNKAVFRTWRDRKSNNYLLMRLPSGGILYYFDPKIKKVEIPWGTRNNSLTCRKRDSVTGQWVRRPLYGGLLCENLVQALCRDLLAEAILRAERAGYPVVLHVHDESLAEKRKGQGSLKEFLKLMTIAPKWAAGMPIEAEGWSGKRYRK